jgi:3-hydroxyisobutyrate dehydrogenase-like beta-hydroxyacid dehydrogenase
LGNLQRVGCVGLGRIGKLMAERVARAGFELHVWNRSRDKADSLLADGARWSESPAELMSVVDVLIVCVTDDRALEQVLFGPTGVAACGRSDGLVVDHSTIHPTAAASLAGRFRPHGSLIDAPVSGGLAGARNGTLSIFAGGDPAALDAVRPVLLRSYAAKVTRVGESGCGQAAKACNQLISFGTASVLAEALTLAGRLGLDVAQLPAAMEGGFADSTVLRTCAPGMVDGRPAGDTLTAVKDLEIISDLGRLSGTPLPIAGLMTSLFRLVALQGHREGGLSSLSHLYAAPGRQMDRSNG